MKDRLADAELQWRWVKTLSRARLQNEIHELRQQINRAGELLSTVKVLRVVVASPGDVQAEHNALPSVGRTQPWHRRGAWTTARTGSLGNGRLSWLSSRRAARADRCHPTHRGLRHPDRDLLETLRNPGAGANSGTEHEFRRAYEAWQRRAAHIYVYFSRRPYMPQDKGRN